MSHWPLLTSIIATFSRIRISCDSSGITPPTNGTQGKTNSPQRTQRARRKKARQKELQIKPPMNANQRNPLACISGRDAMAGRLYSAFSASSAVNCLCCIGICLRLFFLKKINKTDVLPIFKCTTGIKVETIMTNYSSVWHIYPT